jgi:trans-aconitate 2-methyltransferase
MSNAWDPNQYLRFADERARPFDDLVARIGHPSPSLVVDLGCGPGNMTAQLAERWPEARIVGVDNSPEMIDEASSLGRPGALEFLLGDLRSFDAGSPVDVLVSAATLQWVPGHVDLFRRFVGSLAPGGFFAFQVPGNFDQPSHVLMRELASSEHRRDRLGDVFAAGPGSLEPAVYLRALLDAGAAAVDVWETTYLHLLNGQDAVLEWVKGTGLRPVLNALTDEEEKAEFLASYGAALRAAYPRDEKDRTIFPFRRIFAIAQRGS